MFSVHRVLRVTTYSSELYHKFAYISTISKKRDTHAYERRDGGMETKEYVYVVVLEVLSQ